MLAFNKRQNEIFIWSWKKILAVGYIKSRAVLGAGTSLAV